MWIKRATYKALLAAARCSADIANRVASDTRNEAAQQRSVFMKQLQATEAERDRLRSRADAAEAQIVQFHRDLLRGDESVRVLQSLRVAFRFITTMDDSILSEENRERS